MRRRLIPVLILTERFSSQRVIASLDTFSPKPLESAQTETTGGTFAQRRCQPFNSYSRLACFVTDARDGTDQSKKNCGSFRLCRSGISCIPYRTGGHGNAGGLGTVDRHRQVGGVGKGRDCSCCGAGRRAGLLRRFALSAPIEGNLRPAPSSLCARQRRASEATWHCNGGHAASHAVRFRNGGAAGV